jgi:hypothetical protein
LPIAINLRDCRTIKSVDAVEWIAVVGIGIVFALILIGWASEGWQDTTAWDPYQDGKKVIREWIRRWWDRGRD